MESELEPKQRQVLLKQRLAIAAALLSCVAFALVFPWPTEGRLWGEIFDLAHAPVFCWVLLLIVGLCDPAAVGFSQKHPVLLPMTAARIAIIVVLLIGAGAFAEVLQKLVGRSASFGDIAANSVGLLVGVCWICRCRMRPQKNGRLFVIGGLALLVSVSVSPILDAWDCLLQIRSFPVLASFERPREFRNWRAHRARLSQSTEWSTDGQHCAKLELYAGDYPGMLMTWFERDWTQQKSFHIDLKNPGTVDVRFVVKLHDEEHAQRGFPDNDRYHEIVLIPAGKEVSVVVSLDDVKNAPADRQMNMHRIWSIDLFAVDLERETTILIDNIRLQ